MGILYVCNEKMLRVYMPKAISDKICTINNIGPYVKDTSIYSKSFYQLMNNIFLLLDNIMKIMVFK